MHTINGIHRFFQKTSFKRIVGSWMLIILGFAIGYFLLTSFTDSKLLYQDEFLGNNIHGFLNSIYFSVITSTSLGYGDIAPLGFAKFLAVIEVVIGLVMSGIIIAKLVSSKEDAMLEEIYDITFHQKIDRLRNNFYYDRINITSFIEKYKSKSLVDDNDEILYVNLESHLVDLYDFLKKQEEDREYLHTLKEYDIKLILKSLELVFVKYISFRKFLVENNFDVKCLDKYLKSIKKKSRVILKMLNYNGNQKNSNNIKKVVRYLEKI